MVKRLIQNWTRPKNIDSVFDEMPKVVLNLACLKILDSKNDSLYKNWFENWFFSKVLIRKRFSPKSMCFGIITPKKLEDAKFQVFTLKNEHKEIFLMSTIPTIFDFPKTNISSKPEFFWSFRLKTWRMVKKLTQNLTRCRNQIDCDFF